MKIPNKFPVLLISISFLIVGFVGLGLYVTRWQTTKDFQKTTCYVDSVEVIIVTCPREVCSKYHKNDCKDEDYDCYDAQWNVCGFTD